MDTDTPYIPIDCALHSNYELAIIRNTKVVLCWMTADYSERTETVKPVDVISKNKQEFLKIEMPDNSIREIRLDKILHFNPVKN